MQPSKCNVKRSIRALSQISTMAPIFQQYNYFRQNSEENVTFTFTFFSFASNFTWNLSSAGRCQNLMLDVSF